MRNADFDKQILASKKIIEIAKSFDVLYKDDSSYLKAFHRRWYDNDEELYLAMGYFKAASSEIQKKIAIEIINFLCEMES